MDEWYSNNRKCVDRLIDIIIDKLKKNTSFPKEIPYDYAFEWESLRNDLVKYFYFSNDIA
tara:strand:- start:323 stop:502 length:180 start_codon:yes stop_codon:yes gene_type:complete